MKRKTKSQKAIIRNNGLKPFMWVVNQDDERYLIVHNWFTQQYRCLRK